MFEKLLNSKRKEIKKKKVVRLLVTPRLWLAQKLIISSLILQFSNMNSTASF